MEKFSDLDDAVKHYIKHDENDLKLVGINKDHCLTRKQVDEQKIKKVDQSQGQFLEQFK